MLLGDKKGRKGLLFFVCMIVVILLLPVIAIYGLFGWTSVGGESGFLTQEMVYDYIPENYRQEMQESQQHLDSIRTVFKENGLSEIDISKAQSIYLSCLTGREAEVDFYQKLANCFLTEGDLLTNVSSVFGVTFTDADREDFKNLFGGST